MRQMAFNSLGYWQLYTYKKDSGLSPLNDDIISFIKSKAPPHIAYFIAWSVMRCELVRCGWGDCPACDYFVGVFGKPGKEERFKRKRIGISWGKHRKGD